MRLNVNLGLAANDNQDNNADDTMVTLVVVRSLNEDENDDLDDHDDDHLGGGTLPQALLAHAKVCNLDVALLHDIHHQDGCTDNFLEK